MARVFPLEGFGALLITLLKSEEIIFELKDRVHVIWGEDLPLHNGEVDLDLVEPTSVDGKINRVNCGPGLLQSPYRGCTAMYGAVIDHEKDAICSAVGRLLHDLGHELIKGFDVGFGFAATEKFRTMHIPGDEVSQGATAYILVLDAHDLARSWWLRRMRAHPRLNAGLLVGTQNVLVREQRATFPFPMVQIEDPIGLGLKVRIAGKDPRASVPGAQRIVMQPPPYGATADLRHDPSSDDLLSDVGAAESGQRHPALARQFTGPGLDPHDHLRGKNRAGGPAEVHHPTRQAASRSSACATC